jgi:hypothetical protein
MVAQSSDRKAAIYSVRVQTPPTSTRLVDGEKEALKKLLGSCCDIKKAMQVGASNVHICAVV